MTPRQNSNSLVTFLALGAALGCAGCSFMARDTPTYERDTSALLDTRQAQLRGCYDAALVRNPNLAGKLTVTFTVEKKTGEIIDLSWDNNRTTVDELLATCVMTALDGLQLAEPDRRDGEATFSYSFRVRPGA
ncbi:AgmX/PglI C-terminal domain-containing protein [Enhygromyxa salina]|nr:AgmX/PglI C-terminal domain-containing protein [Enhygromyxa salina]